MEQYLGNSEYIDWKHPLVLAKAVDLSAGCLSDEAVAKRCFEFVRDSIRHSWDYRENPVTCKASEVLIHGLNAVYLKQYGWYRIDARGNKPGVAAEFSPPMEKLAFSVVGTSESDFPQIWAEPLPLVLRALTQNKTVEEVFKNLPDIEIIQATGRQE